jgi:hypothetical protein
MPAQDSGAAFGWSWTVLLFHFMHRPFAGESTVTGEPDSHLKLGSLARALFFGSQGKRPSCARFGRAETPRPTRVLRAQDGV